MKKYASILDDSYPGLPTDIWLSDGTLNPVHKDFVIKLLNSFYKNYGLNLVDQWAIDVTVIGSLTTNKFIRTSDFDCHVIVDVDKFIETNMPEASQEDAILYLDNARKEWDRAKILMPLGEHPLELYFETPENPSNTENTGRYSIFLSKWLKPPIYFAQDLDYEEVKKNTIADAILLANELDDSFGEIKRSIRRIEELKEVAVAWPKEKRQLYYNKIQSKLDIIEEEIEKGLAVKQDLVDLRHKKQDAFSDVEIKFKFLARFHYFAILQDLKDLMGETGGEVTTEELPLIEKIISEASKELQKLLIDFDCTLAQENKDHSIGEPVEGAKEALFKLKQQGFEIEIYSCRADNEQGSDDVKEWLDKNGFEYDSIFQGDKPLGTIIDDHAIHFSTWDSTLEQVEKSEKKASLCIISGINLPTIDPKTFTRKEPYALFIGTGDYGSAGKIDMFNVYGEHPMITKSNALPTITLDTLIQNNIPVIGKEPRAGAKQPFQDISSIVRQAKLFSKKEITAQTKKIKQGEYGCLMALVPHELAQEIVSFGVGLIPDEDLYVDENAFGRELECHVTIKYGLVSDDAKTARRLFNNHKPFKAKLGKVKHFEPDVEWGNFDVVTIEVESEDLKDMNKEVCDKLDCAEGLVSDDYKPHITIAYVKKGLGEKFIGSTEFEGKEIELDMVVFSPAVGNKTYFSIGNKKEARAEFMTHLEKKASGDNFLPSLFNAPNNEWQFEHGGSDQEIALDPDSISDEETFYAPCTVGKPRDPDIFRQFLSIFDHPISKKDTDKVSALPSVDQYKKNKVQPLGFSEMMTFRDTAPQEAQDHVDDLIENNKMKDAWIEMEKYLGRRHNNPHFEKAADHDPELEEAEAKSMGEETLLEYSKNFYDPKKHDFPHNTQWFQTYQDQEPSKPLPVTYSPEMNEDNLDQNSPGGYPRRFMGKPKGEWFSNEGEVNDILVDMLKNKEAAINSLTIDIIADLPPQQFIPEGLNAQTAIMTDDGSIYWSDEPKMIHVQFIKQLGIPVDRIVSGGRIVDGIYHDLGPRSDTMRYVEQMLAKKRVEERRKQRIAKQAGSYSSTYTDEQGAEFFNEQHQNDVDQVPYTNFDQRGIDFGFHDSPENTFSGIDWPKDQTPYVVRLDQIENPADRNFPPGLMDYEVLPLYESLPMSDGIEKGNP